MLPIRFLLGAVVLASVFVAVAGDGRAQFGGFDLKNPDGMFDRYAQAQGAKDEIVIDKVQSRLDPEMANKMRAYAARAGITNGKMTKAQFAAFWTKDALPQIEERMKQPFGGFGGKAPGGAPSTPGTPTTPAAPPGGPGGFGKGFGTPPAGEKTAATPDKDKKPPEPSGYQPRPFNEDEAKGNFQSLDRDKSNALDEEEYRRSDIRREVEKWDANQNKLVELDEWLAYAKDRHDEREKERQTREEERRLFEEFKAQRKSQQEALEFKPVPVVPVETLEPDRPLLFRAENLPDALPAWFKELDTDTDGQVGLYEWRAGEKDNAEFAKYDRNRDGLITPEEALWYAENADRLADLQPTGPATSSAAKSEKAAPEKGKGGWGWGGKGGFPKRP